MTPNPIGIGLIPGSEHMVKTLGIAADMDLQADQGEPSLTSF